MKRTIGKFAFSFMLMMLLLMPFCAEAANPILISGAMECETDFLIKALSNSKERRIGGWRFVSGDYQGIPIVVSVTSIGMTNAAAATTLGIEYFKPMAVINQGTSGGHDPALHTFDIVIGVKTFGADAWISHHEKRGADGRHIKLMPSYYYDSNRNETREEIELSADAELLKVALRESNYYQAGKVVSGKIASSNSWNRQLDRIRFFYDKFGSSCEEMETHSVALVCRNYGVPFIGIRILSNTEIHGEEFNPDTGIACQKYSLAVAKAYASYKLGNFAFDRHSNG